MNWIILVTFLSAPAPNNTGAWLEAGHTKYFPSAAACDADIARVRASLHRGRGQSGPANAVCRPAEGYSPVY